jgi:hypothetical protein
MRLTCNFSTTDRRRGHGNRTQSYNVEGLGFLLGRALRESRTFLDTRAVLDELFLLAIVSPSAPSSFMTSRVLPVLLRRLKRFSPP